MKRIVFLIAILCMSVGMAQKKQVKERAGKNSEDNIITDHLNNSYGLTMKYIPYKGGGAVAKDVAGKQIHSSVNNPSEALGFYEVDISLR